MELEVGGPAAEAVEVAGPVVAERQGRALRQRKPVNYNVKSMESNGSNTPSWLKSTVSFTKNVFFFWSQPCCDEVDGTNVRT